MTAGLLPAELVALRTVFGKHHEIERVLLFGSRAKGNCRPESDIDLAICGVRDELQIEALALELDELPLPYRFDVKSLDGIQNPSLREHIERVGLSIYERDERGARTAR